MTNQASEDEILKLLDGVVSCHNDGPTPYSFCSEDSNCGHLKSVQALIRTEKLKLLAAVRERVVGEDHLLFGHGEDWEGAEPQNSLKQDQRIELTKLEAEL